MLRWGAEESCETSERGDEATTSSGGSWVDVPNGWANSYNICIVLDSAILVIPLLHSCTCITTAALRPTSIAGATWRSNRIQLAPSHRARLSASFTA